MHVRHVFIFVPEKTEIGMNYSCGRLGYETQPHYQFQCWTPKEHVQRLMEKRSN